MKRILAIVMGFVILLSMISLVIPVNALSNEVAANVISVPLHSNEISDTNTTVYEIDGFYYMTIGQIARLTNLEIKLSGKEYVVGELHIYDFDDKFDLIGKGYSSLTFVDGIREVTIDLPNGIIREGNNRYNVKIAVYDNHYIIEAVPILKYLLGNDSCYFEKGVFNCITPQETVWSVLGDAFEDANTYCYNYTYFFDDYKKRLAIEIAYQCFMDLRIPKIEEYYRKAIHDILSDNIYTYSGVQELSSKQEQEMTSFLSHDDILDITDVSKDVINSSVSQITEYTINHQLQTLNKDWLKASNLKESSELSKQINIKTNELIDSKNYYNNTETALKAVMYGANIANAFAKNCAYENDTASLLDSAISPEILSNVDTNSWYWLGETNRINSSIKNKWSNLGNSTLDSTIRLFEDEGNDLIVSSIGKGASSYVLIIKTELLVGKLIYKDTYEMVDRDIMSAFESDMQSAYKNLSHTLFVKARNEMYESIDTIEQMLAAYKFYYKLSAIYLKNVSSQYNEATWIGNYADDAAVMYYRLLTCYKTPNSGFDNLKDDVFSSEVLEPVNVISNYWQFGSVVKNDDAIIYTKRDYNSLNYSIIEQNVQTGNSNMLVSTEMASYKNHPNIALIGNSLYYSDKNGVNLYNLETQSTELKWNEGYISIIGLNETEHNLILQREFEDTNYYTYDVSNDECKKIIDLNNSRLLTTDEANVYYYTNDDKIESGFDKTYHTHVYKCELASGKTTELTAITINVPMGVPTYGVSYITNNKLILSYGFYDGGSGGFAYYTIASFDLTTLELKTIATDIETDGAAFEFNGSNVFYCKGTLKQYNVESGEYRSLDLNWIDAATPNAVLYNSRDDNYNYNYCKYDLQGQQSTTLISQSEVLTDSDPNDAYCWYECLGMNNGKAVIKITVYSYQQEYNPVGWRPGHVRSIIKIIDVGDGI